MNNEGNKAMGNQNQLAVIVQESGLEKSKADYILENFVSYFALAAEWEKRAKEIVVTDASQTADMAIARIGRLALKEKRVSLDKERKRLKEQALREGKAIDGIANVLKALIAPIEEYLDKQEHFVEYKKAEEDRLAKLAADKKAEEEYLAGIEADRLAEEEEKRRIQAENDALKKAAQEREVLAAVERTVAAAKLQAEREAAAARQREADAALAAEKAKVAAAKLIVCVCPSCGYAWMNKDWSNE